MVVDGGQGGHHRGHGHRRGIRSAQFKQCRQGTLPPRLVGVVLQPVRGGHPQPMRNPYPGRHLTVLVGGDGLDRSRADVDANCDDFR